MRNHYVPRFYLDFFKEPGSTNTIWVYDKKDNKIRKSTPKNEGFEKNYYPEDIENSLQKIESSVAPVLKKIQEKENLTTEEKRKFADFLGFMVVRVPLFRGNLQKVADEYMNRENERLANDPLYFKKFKREFENKLCKPFNATIDDFKNFVSSGVKLKTTKEYSLLALKEAPKFADLFIDLNWKFIPSNENYQFFTSDNPVYYGFGGFQQWPVFPDKLRNKNLEVTFPVSPDISFLGTFKNIEYLKINNSIIKVINEITLTSALRFIYFSKKSERLITFFEKNREGNLHMIAPLEYNSS